MPGCPGAGVPALPGCLGAPVPDRGSSVRVFRAATVLSLLKDANPRAQLYDRVCCMKWSWEGPGRRS
eukprot:3406331-Pyramimonas_sp.AAC.1